jgi:hypothetical protein
LKHDRHLRLSAHQDSGQIFTNKENGALEDQMKTAFPDKGVLSIETWDKLSQSTVEGSWNLYDGGLKDPEPSFTIRQ